MKNKSERLLRLYLSEGSGADLMDGVLRVNMKSKRSELNRTHKSPGFERKLFYNPIFADGSLLTQVSSVRPKSKSRDVPSKDKRVKAGRDDSPVKNGTPDTAKIRSAAGTITGPDHQSKVICKVPKDGGDINRNISFARENSNESLNTFDSTCAPGNAVLLREDPSTTCQEATVNATVGEGAMSAKKNASVLTDPECLGPCDPGSSVILEGIVWNESRNGLLVVNVTWRGKTYVGTLMDSSNHHWGSPCFKDGTWNLEAKEGEGEGRRLRRNRVSSQKLLRSSDSTMNSSLAFHDEATPATPGGLKEFACTIPSCSKRFKSLSGLKTHKCVAAREASCDPAAPSGDKCSLTNQKTSKMNGRNKQGTLKRKSHSSEEHPCNGNKSDANTCHIQTKCKTKFTDICAFLPQNDLHLLKHANPGKPVRDSPGIKSLGHKRTDKQKKSAKQQNNNSTTNNNNNVQRKKRIKRISQACNNSSGCKSNAFSNEFESSSLNVQPNGAIKGAPLRESADVIRDVGKDNFPPLFDTGHKHENVLTLKSKNFFSSSSSSSRHSYSGGTCSKCPPQPEAYEPLKTPVCRPVVTLLGCSKTPETSTAPTAVPSKASEDLFKTPLEANTASEVFSQDSNHYKQVGSNHPEDYLFSKK